MLGILDNYDSEGIHNIIVNIFDVIMEDTLVFLLHALTQIESNIFLKVDAPVCA